MSKRSTKSFKERALSEVGSKKRVNSKVKGNKNELEVAKALSSWTGVTFRRTPMSGAIHVPLDWLAGDVFCTDKDFDFPFSVEAKHYHKLTPKMKKDFWIQTCNDAARINKYPLLMYREDGWPAKTWKVQMPSRGLMPYILYQQFEMLPIDGLKPAMRINSTDLFDIPYTDILKIFQA